MSRRSCARAASALLALFVGIVLLEHVLVPRLSPATHEISEYANSADGWLMVLGFLAWAVALGLTARVARLEVASSPNPVARRLLVWLLGVAAAGILITACFKTQTTAGALPPGIRLATSGRFHDLGSGVATLALFGAAVASVRVIDRPAIFRRAVVLALGLAVASDLLLLLIGPAVAGVRQRVLLAIGCAWQAFLLAPTAAGAIHGGDAWLDAASRGED